MSRFADFGIEDLKTPGTPTTRGLVLFAGLAVLALVNYFDRIGVFGFGWTNDFVGWVAAYWTGFMTLLIDSRRELQR